MCDILILTKYGNVWAGAGQERQEGRKKSILLLPHRSPKVKHWSIRVILAEGSLVLIEFNTRVQEQAPSRLFFLFLMYIHLYVCYNIYIMKGRYFGT